MLRQEQYKIDTYGLEKSEDIKPEEKSENLINSINNCDIIVTSIPLTKDRKIVNAPFAKQEIVVEDLFKTLQGKKVFSGNIPNEYIENNRQIEFIDLLQNEELTILNSIPSAEGAIQVAMEQSEITINSSKILILGFGRIGKILAKMLSGFGSDGIYCEARKRNRFSLD